MNTHSFDRHSLALLTTRFTRSLALALCLTACADWNKAASSAPESSLLEAAAGTTGTSVGGATGGRAGETQQTASAGAPMRDQVCKLRVPAEHRANPQGCDRNRQRPAGDGTPGSTSPAATCQSDADCTKGLNGR